MQKSLLYPVSQARISTVLFYLLTCDINPPSIIGVHGDSHLHLPCKLMHFEGDCSRVPIPGLSLGELAGSHDTSPRTLGISGWYRLDYLIFAIFLESSGSDL